MSNRGYKRLNQGECQSVRLQCTSTMASERSDQSMDERMDKTDLRSKLPITVVRPGDIKCSMNDVGGYQEAKLEIIEYVNFVKNRERYEKLGARMPKGALLVGPPGTGKTLLARATAAEANIPFIACSSSSLLLGNDGPEKLREIFKFAYEKEPCVLFFDEIDCIARSRDHELAKPETQCLTEELLVQLDGFEQHSDKTLIILASTNSQHDMDHALMRPGRFDRVIEMLQPDTETRMAILRVHLKPLTTGIDKTYLAKRFAVLTDRFSGAQLAAMCNESAMIAAREMNDQISMHHVEEAMDRVWSGMKKKKAIDGDEKLHYARHDAAHAVVAWYLPGTKPPTKLSVLPNSEDTVSCCWSDQCGGFYGSAVTLEEGLNKIAVVLAGVAAEEMFYGGHRTNCSSDLTKATEDAAHLITVCGMSEVLGKLSLAAYYFQQRNSAVPDVSEKLFVEIKQTVEKCYEIAKNAVIEHREKLEKVAELLTMKDLLTADMLVEILGPHPLVDLDTLNFEDADFLPSGLKNWNE